MSEFAELEDALRKLYKGRKYRHHDAFEYHLVGVAELAREKAREANLDPSMAYIMGLLHDVYEDFDINTLDAVAMFIPAGMDRGRIVATIEEVTNEGLTYYDYIRGINDIYALLVKEADLEFNLLQDNAPKLRKYDLYRFALDIIKTKRIVVG